VPGNLAMLNDRLTQMRLRKQSLEDELRIIRRNHADCNVSELRRWARTQLTTLHTAMDGERNDATREVIATYVNKIVVWPSQKRGEMHLNPAAKPLWKCHDRPDGRSWVNRIGATVGSLNRLPPHRRTFKRSCGRPHRRY